MSRRTVLCESLNHAAHMVDAKKAHRCAGCNRIMCPLDGAADDMPDHCDDCWMEVHSGEAA